MPLFAFNVDVAAPPAVVAARVRAVVAPMPTPWRRLGRLCKGAHASDRPFLGNVDAASFRIRPDLRYRNSFLPLIRGRIVSTTAGSRVNVLMFMHPVSLAFMAVWCGSLAAIEWQLLDVHIARSFIPLVLLAVAVALSVGGFYYEVLRAVPQLSRAVFDAAIVTPVEAAFGPESPAALVRRRRVWAPAVAALTLVAIATLAATYEYRLRSNRVYHDAISLAARSAAVRAALGGDVTPGLIVCGVVRDDREGGFAALSVPLSGPAGEGTLHIVANRVGSRWSILRNVLHAAGRAAGVVDVTPSPEREAFRYPARARVFVVPLDSQASTDVKQLPAYFKARLDLDVTVLPTTPVRTDWLDPRTRQLIAEAALDGIEDAHPALVHDLNTVVLGITSEDLNILTSGWTFTLNYRRGRFGVMSTARLHGLPWYAGSNPEVYATRVRKLALKNIALMAYPIELSSDPTSAVASATFTTADVDSMGENLKGESGNAELTDSDTPCVTVAHRARRAQAWRVGCTNEIVSDPGVEVTETYFQPALFVTARTDFLPGGERRFALLRKYRTLDNSVRAFGVGTSDSFDIFPVGDSSTFSYVELIMADGGRIHYSRTSPGNGYATAKLAARRYMGSPFSLSSMVWNNGWDVTTRDGWLYRFPSSGPGRTAAESALVGITSSAHQTLAFRRDDRGDLHEVRGSNGWTIRFDRAANHAIASAADSSGRVVRYSYDVAGRLVHVQDPTMGDTFYRYDSGNRLISISDAEHHQLLANTYGYLGEVHSQTLSDGTRVVYEPGYDEDRNLTYLKLTLPDGYVIEWRMTNDGFVRSWPQLPAAARQPH